MVGIVYVAFDILCIGDIKHLVLIQVILVAAKDSTTKTQQVACCLDVCLYGCLSVIITEPETCLHDKQVFVVISQDSIIVRWIIKIFLPECITYPGHKDIVQVEQIKLILVTATERTPFISPSGREHSTMKLRAVLGVVCQR